MKFLLVLFEFLTRCYGWCATSEGSAAEGHDGDGV